MDDMKEMQAPAAVKVIPREVPTPGAASRAPGNTTDPNTPTDASARKPAGHHNH